MSVNTGLWQRFRYYPAVTDRAKIAHNRVRMDLVNTAIDLCEYVPASRERDLGIEKMEEAMFWFNAAVARAPSEEPTS